MIIWNILEKKIKTYKLPFCQFSEIFCNAQQVLATKNEAAPLANQAECSLQAAWYSNHGFYWGKGICQTEAH